MECLGIIKGHYDNRLAVVMTWFIRLGSVLDVFLRRESGSLVYGYFALRHGGLIKSHLLLMLKDTFSFKLKRIVTIQI